MKNWYRLAAEDLWGSLPATEGIQAAENAWAGGVADFGDPTAGALVSQMPGYHQYRQALQEQVRAVHGNQFVMYRAMTANQFEEWRSGTDMGAASFTFSRRLAENWKNFQANQDKSMVVVQATIQPEFVVMRGKAEENELVIDANQISFDELQRLQ